MDDFHIHTKTTDGKADPAQIIKLAKQLNVKTIAFTEHISKTPTYDWFSFKEKILRLDSAGLRVLVGIEAKVLNESGELNVNGDVLGSADIVLGSCHGVGNVEWLLNSPCDVIAHPQIDPGNIEKFVDCDKVLEINSKHRLPFEVLDRLVLDTKNVFSLGSDTHETADFVVAQTYFAEVLARYPKIRLFKPKS
ncbi:MAG: PHP domain-containing protein [Candidatus Bathyarchaeia archaeon]|jgi:histidinol phosphatase-like PHP family hydrolase